MWDWLWKIINFPQHRWLLLSDMRRLKRHNDILMDVVILTMDTARDIVEERRAAEDELDYEDHQKDILRKERDKAILERDMESAKKAYFVGLAAAYAARLGVEPTEPTTEEIVLIYEERLKHGND